MKIKQRDKQMIYPIKTYYNPHKQLKEQLSFARALNLMAEKIIRNNTTPTVLQTVVAIIGSTLFIDHSVIFKVDFTNDLVTDQYEWLNPNTPNILSFRDTYSLNVFIDAYTYMKHYRHWLETHIDHYGPYFSRDGSGDLIHKYLRIKSALYYPFFFYDQGYYCLSLNQINNCRTWREEEIKFLTSVTNLAEIAIQKINFLDEQKRKKEALLSEGYFYKVFHYSPVSLSLYSLDRERFIDVNECCLEMHGYSRDEFIEQTPLDLNLWVDLNDRIKFYQDLMEKGFAHNHEIKCYKKSGEIFDSLFSGVVIDLNGEKCMLGTRTDITELKQCQREIFHLNSLNLIGEMAVSIAQEIRNPMTTVRGFLQLLGNKIIYRHHENFFTLMISELDRANSLITEFLSLAKNKPMDLKQQNLNYIIVNLLPLIQADAMHEDKYIDLDLNRIENLLADGKEIRQLILNLVRNGLEAMSFGKTLTIKTYMTNQKIILMVQDQGKGIASNTFDKIGIPFFTTKDHGTGLGLAICYSIAARHNASISFETGTSGTTFYASFNPASSVKFMTGTERLNSAMTS